jgi:hypothetical protein
LTASRLTTIQRKPGSDQGPQGQIRQIGKLANQTATDQGSKSDQQNKISPVDALSANSARQYW